jgi:FKBP-type peptidyl-prolyl cis-trans isomerase
MAKPLLSFRFLSTFGEFKSMMMMMMMMCSFLVGLILLLPALSVAWNVGHGKSDVVSRRTMMHHVIVSGCGGTLAAGNLLFIHASPAVAAAETTSNKDLKEEYRQGTSALAGMDSDGPVPREAYKKLPSGVIYADLRAGNKGGAAVVGLGSKVNLQWVLRKSNGYFVDSSIVQGSVPFIFTVGDSAGGAIVGLDEGVRGMTEGSTRRILIPPSLAYVNGVDDGMPGPLPAGFGPRQQIRRVQSVRKDVPGEYLFLEVQVTKVR